MITCRIDSPPSSGPTNPKRASHRGVLAIGINFGLHTHKLCENLGIRVVLEWAILPDSRNRIFVDGSSQL